MNWGEVAIWAASIFIVVVVAIIAVGAIIVLLRATFTGKEPW